ncbi:MAG: hypothetical protein HY681_13885 [Chloroflexi bacterium]|nr:hypothetical protein [Chloroflexota bacterium]
MKPQRIFMPLALAALLPAVFLAACSGGEQTVRGHVQDVQARSLTEVETLTLEDSDGKVWRFQSEGNIGFTPSHIREHMLRGEEMTVYYTRQGDRLTAVRVTD